MNKQTANETTKVINELAIKLQELMELQIQAINSLPNADKKRVDFVFSEMEAIKKGIKEGNNEPFEHLLKKYADTNT